MDLKKNYKLADHNTLGLPVRADYFTLIHNLDHLHEAINWCQQKHIPLLPLGQGSNVIFTRDVQALVAKINLPGIQLVKQTSDNVCLRVGAGVIWDQLVSYCLKHKYFGTENLTLIPGTVGAAPIQNIGAYGVELKDVFVSLTAVHRQTGLTRTFDKAACQFSYRHSIFKEPGYKDYIICNLTLCLNKHFVPQLDYPALKAQAKSDKSWCDQIKNINAAKVSEWVKTIRQAKLPDPQTLPNVGSFFHNPVISSKDYHQLKQQFRDLPCYPTLRQQTAEQKVKIPAGWLVEQTGWLGFRDTSGAGVHDKQALVLVNYAKASGKDMMNLASRIQDSVWRKFAIRLNIEPCVY